MNSPHVLIVEDDDDAQHVVQHILEYLEVEVDCASDAERAEVMIFDNPSRYDVVLIDLALPGKDGWQLLNDIRSSSDTSHVKCVAMTAFHRPLLKDQALRAGFVAYFPKPFNASAFAETIGQIVRDK
jgi:CheY-like chemotaxis protein